MVQLYKMLTYRLYLLLFCFFRFVLVSMWVGNLNLIFMFKDAIANTECVVCNRLFRTLKVVHIHQGKVTSSHLR